MTSFIKILGGNRNKKVNLYKISLTLNITAQKLQQNKQIYEILSKQYQSLLFSKSPSHHTYRVVIEKIMLNKNIHLLYKYEHNVCALSLNGFAIQKSNLRKNTFLAAQQQVIIANQQNKNHKPRELKHHITVVCTSSKLTSIMNTLHVVCLPCSISSTHTQSARVITLRVSFTFLLITVYFTTFSKASCKII